MGKWGECPLLVSLWDSACGRWIVAGKSRVPLLAKQGWGTDGRGNDPRNPECVRFMLRPPPFADGEEWGTQLGNRVSQYVWTGVVGCVIAIAGAVLGCGARAAPGELHAIPNALSADEPISSNCAGHLFGCPVAVGQKSFGPWAI